MDKSVRDTEKATDREAVRCSERQGDYVEVPIRLRPQPGVADASCH
jgi:hypothetical protein